MKTKSPKGLFNLKLQTCFASEELWRYRYGHIDSDLRSAIDTHLNVDQCESCLEIFLTLSSNPLSVEIPNRLSSASQRLIQKWAHQTPATRFEEHPTRLTAGQIWSTSSCLLSQLNEAEWFTPVGGPVLIIHPGPGNQSGVVRVMPLSFEILYARHPFSLVISDITLSSGSLLVEIFNERPMLAEHLDRYLGMVNDNDLKTVHDTRCAFLNRPDTDEPADPGYETWVKSEIRLAEHLSVPVMNHLESDIPEKDDFDIIRPWMAPEFMIQPVQLYAQGKRSVLTLPPEPLILLDFPDLQLGLVQKQDQIILRLIHAKPSQVCIEIDGNPVALMPVGDDVQEAVIGYAQSMYNQIALVVRYQDRQWEFRPRFIPKK